MFAVVTTALRLLFDSLAAHALVRLRFRRATECFWPVITLLMVSFRITLILVFATVFHLGRLDTYRGLAVEHDR